MIITRLVSFVALLAISPVNHAAWETAHGDSDNTGFARVDTAPARSPKQFAQLGPLAPGANPVIGADGTLYIGNLQGQLLAIHADGTPAWTRQLNANHGGIYAAPAIGADGSIYVVSTFKYRDHRGEATGSTHFESWLHKFTPGGGWVFASPFPEHFSFFVDHVGRGATTAAPNIWRKDGAEAIMIPVVYKGPFGRDLRLIAFSTTGNVLADQRVTYTAYEVSGGSGAPDWLIGCYSLTWYFPAFCVTAAYVNGDCCSFSTTVPGPLSGAPWPLPNAAVWQHPQGGTPWIMVSDGDHNTVGYTFSPTTGFYEYIRTQDNKRKDTSPPVVLTDGHTVLGTDDGRLTFNGPNGIAVPSVANLGPITAAPTRMADGRLVIVSRSGLMTVLSNNSIAMQLPLAGHSIASAAASCTHVFVADTEEFVTYSARTLQPVARVPWVGGGLAAPVIGPSGHVYAIASNSLFVFPPPTTLSPLARLTGKTSCDRPVIESFHLIEQR